MKYTSTLTLRVLLIFLLLLLVLALYFGQFRKTTVQTSVDFFESAQFRGDFTRYLPSDNIDSAVFLIKKLVPGPFQLLACQRLYYSLDEDASIDLRLQHLDLFDRYIMNDSLAAFVQMVRGELFIEMARFEDALQCLDACTALSLKINHPVQAADAKRFKARAFLLEGSYPQAIQLLLEVFEVYQQFPGEGLDQRFNIRIDLGNAYRAIKDFKEALKWHQEALKLILILNARGKMVAGSSGFHTVATEKIGEDYLDLNLPDSALYFANQSLLTRNQYNVTYDQTASELLFSKVYLEKGDCNLSLIHLRKAEQANVQKGNMIKKIKIYSALGESYLCLGQMDSSEYFLKKCLTSRDTGLLAYVHEQLGNIAMKQGNLPLALEEMTRSRQFHDASFNVEKSKMLAYQNVRIALAQKELQIANIEKQRKQTLLISLLTLAGLILALGVAFLLLISQRRKQFIFKQERELFEMREKLQQRALERSQQELVAQQAQLQHSTLLLELKNQLIEELETRLSNATDAMETTGMPEKDLGRMRILTDADWLHFLGRFERIAPGFIFRLKAAFPNLTLAETRLFLLVKLYFDSREISDATGISQESVWRGRHRLRKKLGLSEQVNLDEYIQSF